MVALAILELELAAQTRLARTFGNPFASALDCWDYSMNQQVFVPLRFFGHHLPRVKWMVRYMVCLHCVLSKVCTHI